MTPIACAIADLPHGHSLSPHQCLQFFVLHHPCHESACVPSLARCESRKKNEFESIGAGSRSFPPGDNRERCRQTCQVSTEAVAYMPNLAELPRVGTDLARNMARAATRRLCDGYFRCVSHRLFPSMFASNYHQHIHFKGTVNQKIRHTYEKGQSGTLRTSRLAKSLKRDTLPMLIHYQKTIRLSMIRSPNA